MAQAEIEAAVGWRGNDVFIGGTKLIKVCVRRCGGG